MGCKENNSGKGKFHGTSKVQRSSTAQLLIVVDSIVSRLSRSVEGTCRSETQPLVGILTLYCVVPGSQVEGGVVVSLTGLLHRAHWKIRPILGPSVPFAQMRRAL